MTRSHGHPHGIQGKVVVQHLGQFCKVEAALEVFDQLCVQLSAAHPAFERSWPAARNALCDVTVLVWPFSSDFVRWRFDEAAQASGVQKRDLGVLPVGAWMRGYPTRMRLWLHVWQRLHQRVYGIVDGRV